MENLKYSFMMHWKTIPYVKLENFRDYYAEDCSNMSYYVEWDKIVKYHAAIGYKGIELMPFERFNILKLFGTYQNFLDFIRERGVERITGMFCGAGASYDKANHKALLEQLQGVIDDTYTLGGENINVCPSVDYYGVGPLSAEGLKNTADFLNELGKRSYEKGITTCIHNEFFCASNKNEHDRLIEMTDPKYVAYCLDTAQVSLMGFDPVQFYEKYHDRVKYFHLKDTALPNQPDSVRFSQGIEITDDGTRWFWELGGGTVDFKGLWKLLKKYGHKGWMTVENDGTPDLLAAMALSKWYIDHELSPIYK